MKDETIIKELGNIKAILETIRDKYLKANANSLGEPWALEVIKTKQRQIGALDAAIGKLSNG